MLCDYFSLPCFVLIQITDKISQFNSTDRSSCQQRCDEIDLDVPGFSRVQKLDPKKIYSQCQEKYIKKATHIDHSDKKEICTFPIKTKYSFETDEWFDEDSNEVRVCTFWI